VDHIDLFMGLGRWCNYLWYPTKLIISNKMEN
jgi:hypothetical protein